MRAKHARQIRLGIYAAKADIAYMIKFRQPPPFVVPLSQQLASDAYIRVLVRAIDRIRVSDD